jgi:hypothetical protein
MAREARLAGDGEHGVHVSTRGDDAGPLAPGAEYVSVDACSWFVNREDGWLRKWAVSGMIDATLGASVERYQVGLGTFELDGSARIAPVFDRPIVHDRCYRGGPLTFAVSLFAAARDTPLTALLRGASAASLGISASMVQTATLAGPQRVLGAAAGSLMAGLTSLVAQPDSGLRPIFAREGLEVTLQPDQVRTGTVFILFHRGAPLEDHELQIRSVDGGRDVPFRSGRPLEDGVWLLLRLRRGAVYSGQRDWFEQERALRADVENLVADAIAGVLPAEVALARLQVGQSGVETLFDHFRALRHVVQRDGVLTEAEARARVAGLAERIGAARRAIGGGVRALSAAPAGDADLRAEVASAEKRNGAAPPRDRVLLIGIDGYAEHPLGGCVNDVLAFRAALEDRFGVKPEAFTVLASPAAERAVDGARPATHAAIGRALDQLAGDDVSPSDRVIIYFSGHGGYQKVTGGELSHQVECLVPVDYRKPDGPLLYDAEMNRRLAAIARRTPNVTVILDCCYAAGATRDGGVDGAGASESIRTFPLPPRHDAERARDPAEPGSATRLADRRAHVLTIAACLADEGARETTEDGHPQGRFTRALVRVLRSASGQLTWREIWSQVRAATRPGQTPTVHGDDRHFLFGALRAGDPGELRVEPNGESYEVAAGTLVDITDGTEIAVYGESPARLPPLGPEDRAVRVGTLRVEAAQPASARARAERPFQWPRGARCRVARFGEAVLSVGFESPRPASLAAELDDLGLGRAIRLDAERPDLQHVKEGGSWLLCDDVHGLAARGAPELFRCGDAELARAIGAYIHYAAPLRVARRAPDLEGTLRLRLLRAERIPANPQAPDLPDVDGDDRFRCVVRIGQPFCVVLENHSSTAFRSAAILNCGTSGRVQHLAAFVLPALGRHAVWLDEEHGTPFRLVGPVGVERLVAIASTRPEPDWRFLRTEGGFAAAIRMAGVARDFPQPPRSPGDFAAVTVAVRVNA